MSAASRLFIPEQNIPVNMLDTSRTDSTAVLASTLCVGDFVLHGRNKYQGNVPTTVGPRAFELPQRQMK